MSKYAKIYQNSIKNIEKNSFREKKFLAHSGGWIVLKIIFWPIFSQIVSKLIGFWMIIAFFNGKFYH
jgi:hypothetical protein